MEEVFMALAAIVFGGLGIIWGLTPEWHKSWGEKEGKKIPALRGVILFIGLVVLGGGFALLTIDMWYPDGSSSSTWRHLSATSTPTATSQESSPTPVAAPKPQAPSEQETTPTGTPQPRATHNPTTTQAAITRSSVVGHAKVLVWKYLGEPRYDECTVTSVETLVEGDMWEVVGKFAYAGKEARFFDAIIEIRPNGDSSLWAFSWK